MVATQHWQRLRKREEKPLFWTDFRWDIFWSSPKNKKNLQLDIAPPVVSPLKSKETSIYFPWNEENMFRVKSFNVLIWTEWSFYCWWQKSSNEHFWWNSPLCKLNGDDYTNNKPIWWHFLKMMKSKELWKVQRFDNERLEAFIAKRWHLDKGDVDTIALQWCNSDGWIVLQFWW